jgi:dynein heavy chain
MKRAWTSYSKEEIEDKNPKIKTILFALCYFYSVMLERRKLGLKRWNKLYQFSAGYLRDYQLCIITILKTINHQEKFHGII